MPKSLRHAVFKDPELAPLFSQEDPMHVFTDLRQIGCGSFGAVFYVSIFGILSSILTRLENDLLAKL